MVGETHHCSGKLLRSESKYSMKKMSSGKFWNCPDLLGLFFSKSIYVKPVESNSQPSSAASKRLR